MRIKKLPQDVSVRIAAGEVVERPSSIAKELIENSIDAMSTEISIYLESGGKSSFVIEDDGIGIAFEDLPLAVERYATSKIDKIEDLENISTLGYRGEALASIAAVSKLEIRSRQRGSEPDSGGIIKCEADIITLHTQNPCRVGTRIQVDDLFFNLPARRKFLKNSSAETRRIVQVVNDYALIHPEISFKVFSDGKKVVDYIRLESIDETVGRFWGPDSEKLYASYENENGSVRLWWNPLPDSRRVVVSLFVNGRRVQDSTVRAALCAGDGVAYGEWVVLLDMPYDELDVNIHPTKEEIRFRKSQFVFRLVYHAANEVFAKRLSVGEKSQAEGLLSEDNFSLNNFAQSIYKEEDARLAQPRETESLFRPLNATENIAKTETAYVSQQPVSDNRTVYGNVQMNAPHVQAATRVACDTCVIEEKKKISDYDIHYIGQTGRGFLLFDIPEAIAVVDPHAAHERINYEEIREAFKDAVVVQELTVPLEIPPMVMAELTSTNEKVLKELGFHVNDNYLVGVPNIRGKGHLNPIEMLRSALRGLESETDRTKIDREVWWRIARLACRNSVKLGWKFDRLEAEELMVRLNECETPFTCPHGRPTIFLIRNKKLEEWFER